MSRSFDNAPNEVLSLSSAPLTVHPVSIAGWFRADDATVSMAILWLGDSSSDSPGKNSWRLLAAGGTAGDPVSALTGHGSGSATASSTTGFTVDTWHHAAGVYSSTSSRSAFIDGGSKGTNTFTREPSGVDALAIGRTDVVSPSTGFLGRVAEVGLWDIALTDAEVAVLAGGRESASCPPGKYQRLLAALRRVA